MTFEPLVKYRVTVREDGKHIGPDGISRAVVNERVHLVFSVSSDQARAFVAAAYPTADITVVAERRRRT